MNQDLTKGQVMRSMLRFAVLMILENLLQQCYNIADTLIVGRCLGANALAAVGSAFMLMTFLTSILLGLCMGSGAVFSIRFGERDEKGLIEGVYASFLRANGNSVVPLIFLAVSAVLNIALDLWFVLGLKRGVTGEAEATVIAQYVSGIGIAVYALQRCRIFRKYGERCWVRWNCIKEIAGFSFPTCIQQSVMNLGIL